MLRTIALLLLTPLLDAQVPVPVIVELFTSEGCSSCPPADTLLAELEKNQPVKNAEIIVLSEHVDYWNQIGWADPFSSPIFSRRQQAYAGTQGSGDVYTPEAIVDGHFATVGSNRANLLKAITDSASRQKPPLEIAVKREGDKIVVQVPEIVHGNVWVALTQGAVVSRVAAGENGGRTLHHVGVVRLLEKSSAGQARFKVDHNWGSELRVVAFVQDAGSGRITQAVQRVL